MSFRIGEVALDGRSVLAPMAGYTDAAYRVLCREQGAALVVSEMVSADGLIRCVKATRRMIRVLDAERPVCVQLYGRDPDAMAEAAAITCAEQAPDLIDLNMGCPARKVVRKGSGVALMREPALALRIAREVVRAASCPVTAKIRSGWSAEERNAPELAAGLQDAGVAAIAIHARTRVQVHAGEVDHALVGALVEQLAIPVIGNGGLRSAADARRMLDDTGAAAVMIGRAAIGNPWIFRDVERALADGGPREAPGGDTPAAPPAEAEVRDAVTRHLDALIAAHVEAGVDGAERRACSHLRGHLVRYTAGWRRSVTFRRRLNELTDRAAVLEALDEVLAGGHASIPRAGSR